MSVQEKTIAINVPGAEGDEKPRVVVTPGTTARDVLEAVKLEDFWLKKPHDDGFYGQDEAVWTSVKDGDSLEATARAQVGAAARLVTSGQQSFLSRLIQHFRAEPLRSGPRVVRPRNRSYLVRRGWRWNGKTAIGWYRTRLGSWRGRVCMDLLGRPQFYIAELPEHVPNGQHGACFRWKGPSKGYHIHFRSEPKDVDSGLMAAEAALGGRA